MKVLFQSRTTLFSVPGGDTVQILNTAAALRKKGCFVDVSTELEPDVSGYDLIHIFNLMRPQEVYLQARNAKKYRKPVALSTIYGLYTEFEKKARGGLLGFCANRLGNYQIEYMKVLSRAILNLEINKGTIMCLKKGYLVLQKEICRMVDVYLPNSDSEMRRVAQDMGLEQFHHVVVPNAVDEDKFNYDTAAITTDAFKYKDCILSVARIEGRKSQLNLILAVNDLPYTLVIIGKPGPNSVKYYKECRKNAGRNVVFLGHVDHDSLPQFYRVARVHALISWMETPGLSSLEAGAMGCNLVITDKGDTRDYFRDYAFYCEPDSIVSIRSALKKAFETPVNPALAQHILRNYTWEKTAEKTLEGYTQVFNRNVLQ